MKWLWLSAGLVGAAMAGLARALEVRSEGWAVVCFLGAWALGMAGVGCWLRWRHG